MKKLFKNTNLMIILFVTLSFTTSCNAYTNGNITPNNAKDYANIEALVRDAHYVKFSYTPTGAICCMDGDGNGLADLKPNYGYQYNQNMPAFWFSTKNSIARGTPCDEFGNELTVNGKKQSIPVAAGTFTGVQAYSNAYPHIYEFRVTATWYVYPENVSSSGTYIRSLDAGTNLKLVINE